jgi:iron complex transport system substrate-binding protein
MKVLLLVLFLLLSVSCRIAEEDTDDTKFIVLGPSLVEIMFASGLGGRIVGVDTYSEWPPIVQELPSVGGYVDPSLERISSLSPTSIHVSGNSPVLHELAEALDIPCYSYRFDTLEDVFAVLDSLDARYGADAKEYKNELEIRLDSLQYLMGNTESVSCMIVVYHERGSSSMTIAGRNTFFADLLSEMNCKIAAPAVGAWPMISAEGVLEMAPDHIICLYPGRTDTAAVIFSENDFWVDLGFETSRVHCLFEPYIMIPGGRLVEIAERICSCLL